MLAMLINIHNASSSTSMNRCMHASIVSRVCYKVSYGLAAAREVAEVRACSGNSSQELHETPGIPAYLVCFFFLGGGNCSQPMVSTMAKDLHRRLW